MHNCLTVDVEDWFHICGVAGPLGPANWDNLPSRVVPTTRMLLDVLDRCGARATFFVVGWIADRYPELVGAILEGGHEVGSHSHLHRRVFELTPAAFAADLEESVRSLAAAGAEQIKGFRAPEWSINQRSLWALDVLVGADFYFDSSMAPLRLIGDVRYPHHPHARATALGQIFEFPPLVARRFGQMMPIGFGWGLRMNSPSRLLRVIQRHNAQGIPVTLAVHPWELDPDPPRVSLPAAKQFAHYFRLDGFNRRFEQIVNQLSWAPMGEVLGCIS